MHYLLFYTYAPDYLQRRPAFRDAHLALAWESHRRGELALGGAVGDPPDSAVLLFKGNSPVAAERFAAADPYVQNGLVTAWRVQPWRTVVGTEAAEPIEPKPRVR